MKLGEGTLTIEEREISFLIQSCLRTYRFYKKTLPQKIAIVKFNAVAFKQDVTSGAIKIPVEFIESVKEEIDASSGQQRTRRDTKTSKTVRTSNKDAAKSE